MKAFREIFWYAPETLSFSVKQAVETAATNLRQEVEGFLQKVAS